MSFEKTTPDNKYQLTKKQHFHMRAILEKFDSGKGILITKKSDRSSIITNSDDQLFMANRAWSEECETKISHPIENKFLAQVRRVENNESICDHEAISKYHLLWKLRHHYAKNECEDHALYNEFPCGTVDKEVEELIESWGKVPIRAGGMIAGRFKATLDIKALLQDNDDAHEGIRWQVVRSESIDFISADCYGDSCVIIISPNTMLWGQYEMHKKEVVASSKEIIEFNDYSKNTCDSFYFEMGS